MSTKYLLPNWLGGKECTLVNEAELTGGCPSVRVEVEGNVITVPFLALTKVKPPLPPEPLVGSVVRAQVENGAWILFERMNTTHECCWRSPTFASRYTWFGLNEYSEPMLLVPEKPAEKRSVLPLILSTSATTFPRTVRVDRRGLRVGLEITAEGRTPNTYRASLRPHQATEVARALDAAAKEIKEAEGTMS